MRMSGIEDWALALTLVSAIAFTVTINQVRHAHAATPVTVAAAQSQGAPLYVMTITAKRLPTACKGTAAAANAVYCTTFLEADAVVEMHETAAGYAARANAVDAELAYNK